VLTVKRLHPVAGYADGLDAVARVARDVPGLLWAIAGDGHLRAEIEAGARARGLTSAVRLLGLTPQAELPRWYRAADVFFLPSRLESWGAVTLEALACGTPVVATATAGTREVHDLFPADVALVPVGDPEAMAGALAGALAVLRRVTDATARRLDDQFRVDAAASAYLGVYRRVLEG
jgi:glycosyltransferase involved in cell wall biosynthesis